MLQRPSGGRWSRKANRIFLVRDAGSFSSYLSTRTRAYLEVSTDERGDELPCGGEGAVVAMTDYRKDDVV